jgi:hypothetical protein
MAVGVSIVGLIDFDYNARETVANVITAGVGPTTDPDARTLPNTNSAQYLYVSSTGSDANTGLSPAQAVRTINYAYGLLNSGGLYATISTIHILDSGTYQVNTLVMTFNNNTTRRGIQSALGQAPTIQLDASSAIILGATQSFLAGCFVRNDFAYLLVAATSTATIVDNWIESTKQLLTNATDEPNQKVGVVNATNMADISGNVIIGYPTRTLVVRNTAAASTTNRNIIINRGAAFDGSTPNQIASDYLYVGDDATVAFPTLVVDFNLPTLIATIDVTSTVTTLVPGAWAGYYLYFTAGGYTLRITNNSTTQLFLTNPFNEAIPTTANANVAIKALAKRSPVYIDGYTSGTLAMTIDRNILVCEGSVGVAGIVVEAKAGVTSSVINAGGNTVQNCLYGILSIQAPQTSSNIATTNDNYGLYYTTLQTGFSLPNLASLTPAAGNTIVSTNTVSNRINPLYFNPTLTIDPTMISSFVVPPTTSYAFTTTAWNYRLRARGKQYNYGGKPMLLTSQLIAAYGGIDLNPWTETLGTGDVSYDSTLQLNRPNMKLLMSFIASNPVELNDLHGNLKIDWNSYRKELTLSWDEGAYVSNTVIWKLYALLQSKKPKLMFPKGRGNTMMVSSTSGEFGQFTTTTGYFEPSGRTVPMRENHWAGFWITIDDGSTGDLPRYYISSNDESSLYLIDKLGFGLPAEDEYSFIIDQILVQNRTTPLEFQQQGFTNFDFGGQWDEFSETETKFQEYTNVSIVFVEAENPIL